MSAADQFHLLTARVTLLEKNISELQAIVGKLNGSSSGPKPVPKVTKAAPKTNPKTSSTPAPHKPKSDLKQRLPNVGTSWTDAEHATLLTELKASNTIEQIAASHLRTTGGVEARIRKHIKIAREKGSSDEAIANELGKDLQFVELYGTDPVKQVVVTATDPVKSVTATAAAYWSSRTGF